MQLVRYSPFSDLGTLLNFRPFEEAVSRAFHQSNSSRPWVPAVDIQETDHALVFNADVPGVKFEDIDVQLESGTLTIKGERKFEQEKTEGGWHRAERSYGAFERAFTVPETVNPEGTQADYKDGVLTVTLPKKEIAKPRQIKVNVNNN